MQRRKLQPNKERGKNQRNRQEMVDDRKAKIVITNTCQMSKTKNNNKKRKAGVWKERHGRYKTDPRGTSED